MEQFPDCFWNIHNKEKPNSHPEVSDRKLKYIIDWDNIEGVYGYLRAVGDESTPGDQGAEDGDVMTFYVNGYLAEVVSGDNTWTQWGQKQVDIRAISGENVPEFSLIMVPFMLSLMIYGMSRRRIGL